MSARTSTEPHRLPPMTERRSAPAATPRDHRVFVGAVTLAVLSVGGAIISGFYDGGYSDPARSSLHVVYQLVFVAAIAVVGVLAALRFVSLVRRRG